ncbi:hypothetical protein ABPG74_011709 [Tetrahymena malaccensis]
MNDVVDASQETAVNNQYLCLQQSENLIKSIQKKLLQFKQSSENLYSCQKSLHEDLIALQDKYLEKEIKVEINALFDGFSQALLCIQQNLSSIPQKINDFIQNIDGISKNQWKKRQFLKEKYEHYLTKVQDLVLKQEEQAAKQNPNSFILSAGTGVGTITLQQRKNNPKVTRNNDKLKNSATKYQDINNRVAQELSNLFKMRNGIISAIGKQLADSLIENITPIQSTIDSVKKKSDSVAISQNSNRSNNGAAGGNTSNCNAKIKFSSINSMEQEQLEKEITIRGIFKIPATMDLPVIRRRSIKITQDGQVVNDHGGNNKKEYNPVPFESSNPNIIIYLSRLVQQDKNIFDFEDFNNKDANQNEENSDNSNNNQVQDHSGLEGSIERVYTEESHSNDFEENSEDKEEEDSQNIVICDDSDDSKSNENTQDQDDQKKNNNLSKQQNNNKNTSISKDPKNIQKIKSQKKRSIKKQQQQILSDSIFRYEQERKKQLINQILIKEGGTIASAANQSINGNSNPQSQNCFNNYFQSQQPQNYQPQNKQQISPQSSLPDKSNKSNLSQGSANQNKQITINSLQDQLVQQRNYQHKQNSNNLNPNQFHSASYQVPSSSSIKTPNFNNNQLQQQQQPVNFSAQNFNNNFGNQTSTNTTNNNLSINKQNNISIQIQQQSRSNQSWSNLPSPKQFNNINNTVNQQVSTPQNVNSNNHQAGFSQSRNQFPQQLYLSPNQQNSQQSFSNYLSPQKEGRASQNSIYQQQGNSNLNQANQSQLNYQQQDSQFVQQINRNSQPNNFNNSYGIQNTNAQMPSYTIQKKPSQNSLNDQNQIQRMSLQSPQQQQQNFQKMQSQNYFNGYVHMQQNSQAIQTPLRKNSDNSFNQRESYTKNAQNQPSNINISEPQLQQNQNNNIINQQQQQQKSQDQILTFNNLSEKLINNQISNGFQQQKQQQNYQNSNQTNGFMLNSNNIPNSQMMQQQSINGINKINKVNSLQLEENKAQNQAYQGSSTTTNQQQIRNFYQQQQSTFKKFVNSESGNEKTNLKLSNQIERQQKQNEDNESDESSILSLTLIDD